MQRRGKKQHSIVFAMAAVLMGLGSTASASTVGLPGVSVTSLVHSHTIDLEGGAVFTSDAGNFVPGDTNGRVDVFVRDRLAGTTERVSVDSNELEANGTSSYGSITPDGRYVAFTSFANNLVPGDTNFWPDVFLRDRASGTTEIVSLSTGGGQGNFGVGLISISADARYVVSRTKDDLHVAGLGMDPCGGRRAALVGTWKKS